MKTHELICRKAKKEDDLVLIARYLHLTDPYIYPAITHESDDAFWLSVVERAFSAKDNLFSMEHLWVALWEDRIVGVCCMIPCGRRMRFLEDLALSEEQTQRLSLAYEGYFLPLMEESETFEGFNITNVCVDSAYRGRGIGETLLKECLSSSDGSVVHLDVIADNLTAIRLYERMGFAIVKSYDGFSGTEMPLRCYHMEKTK